MNFLLRLFLLCTSTLPGVAAAMPYTEVALPDSTLTFSYRQMGVPMEGRFRQFTAHVAFDPARPEAAHISLEIPLAGIDTGVAEADSEVQGKLWFDARTFPVARFVASEVRALGGNRYEMRGRLTLKGKTQDIIVPFNLQAEEARAIATGALILKRLDYGIGDGIWRDVSAVADEVQIHFRFVVRATPRTHP
ncbi:MAG: YceI family protein [Sideroxydans sp.]